MQKSVIANIVLFQAGWFACVISASQNQPWIGVLIVMVIMALHLLRARWPLQELSLMIIAIFIGLCFDSLLVWQNWLEYSSGLLTANIAPYWIVILWGLFATTVNLSLSWFKDKLIYSAIAGAVAGPLAYYAGQNLGALTFTNPPIALAALSIGWGLFTPLLIYLSNYYDGYRIQTQRRVSWTG